MAVHPPHRFLKCWWVRARAQTPESHPQNSIVWDSCVLVTPSGNVVSPEGDGYFLEPTEWTKGSQASSGVWREDSGLHSRTCMHWRRKWQPTPVFLPGESQGQGSLVGCRIWGRNYMRYSRAPLNVVLHEIYLNGDIHSPTCNHLFPAYTFFNIEISSK